MKRKLFFTITLAMSVAVFSQQNVSFLNFSNLTSYYPHNVSLLVTPAYDNLLYSSDLGKSSGAFGVGIGVEYCYRFSGYLGVSIGAKWMQYSSSFKFRNYEFKTNGVDMSDPELEGGNPYIFRINYDQREKQLAHYIETPVKINFFAPVANRIDFKGSVGFNLGFRVADRQEMDGFTSYTRTADFTDGHFIINNVKSLGLGTYTDFMEQYKGHLFTVSTGVVADVGLNFLVANRSFLYVGLSGGYGFNDVREQSLKKSERSLVDKAFYQGLMSTNFINKNGVHTLFGGVTVGFTYCFGDMESVVKIVRRRR